MFHPKFKNRHWKIIQKIIEGVILDYRTRAIRRASTIPRIISHGSSNLKSDHPSFLPQRDLPCHQQIVQILLHCCYCCCLHWLSPRSGHRPYQLRLDPLCRGQIRRCRRACLADRPGEGHRALGKISTTCQKSEDGLTHQLACSQTF